MRIEYPEASWKDYEIIDSGRGEKLERYGRFVMARPEPKALWDKSLSDAEWSRLMHTRFAPGAGFGKAGKEDSGTWERLKKMDDQWYIAYRSPDQDLKIRLRLGLTSLKFAKLEDLIKSIGMEKCHVCTHCFDGSSYCHEHDNEDNRQLKIDF